MLEWLTGREVRLKTMAFFRRGESYSIDIANVDTTHFCVCFSVLA
jgi:hypothetical protein